MAGIWEPFDSNGLGIIDTHGGDRVAKVTRKGVEDMTDTLHTGRDEALSGWGSDMPELQEYRDNSGNAVSRIAGAGVDPNSASAWLNPKMDLMLNNAARGVAGGAGAGLQSSATNNAVADRIGAMSGEMWDKATQAAFMNSQNEQNIGKTTADIYQQQFENNMLPKSFRSQTILDTAANEANLKGQMYGAQAAAAGKNKGLISGFLGSL